MCRTRTRLACLSGLLLVGIAAAPAQAVFRIWDPVNFSVDWHSAANWDPTGVPTSNDDVQLSNPGIGAVLTGDSQPVNSLLLTAGRLSTNGHRLFVDENNVDGLLTVNGLGGHSATLNVSPLREPPPEFEPFALRVDRARVLSAGTLSFSTGNSGEITAVTDRHMEVGPGGAVRTSGTGTTTMQFNLALGGPELSVDGAVTVSNNSTLEVLGVAVDPSGVETDAEFGESSVVNIESGGTLSFETVRAVTRGTVNIGPGGTLRTVQTGTLNNTGSVNLDDGLISISMERLSNRGLISGQGTITTGELSNIGQITGGHSITTQHLRNTKHPLSDPVDIPEIVGRHTIITQALENIGGTISAVGGTTTINADTLLVQNVRSISLEFELPGVLNAVEGDMELMNVTEGRVVKRDVVDDFGGEVRVATGHEFRLTNSSLTFESGGLAHFAGGAFDAADSQLTFQDGSTVHFTGGGTILGGGTAGAMLGRGLEFEAGSVIQVDCCEEARVENASAFDNVRLGGDVTLDADLRLLRTAVVENTSTFTGNGSLIVDPIGELFVQGGTTFAADVVNEGRLNIEPDLGTGQIQVNAKYTQTAAGTLDIHLNNVVANQFDALAVDGNVILDGTLNVFPTPEFDAVVGNTFTIMSSTFGLVSGEFASEVVPVFDGLTFDVIYNPQSVVLEVVEAALPGDFNGDGAVDAADYVIWRKIDGTASGYNMWRANFGAVAGEGSAWLANPKSSRSMSVPEPVGLVLTLVGSIMAFAAMRR